MGCTSAKQESNQTQDTTQKTTFAPRSPQEQAILDQLGGLGTAQQNALMQQIQSLTSGASPYALAPADQELLNQRYKSAEEQLALQGKDYADFLSGGRGLRMSDTPISSQALQRYGLGQSALQSEKANASLNMGLQGNQYRTNAALGLSGAMPSGLTAAFNPLFQERLAGGTQTFHGQSRGSQTNTPSLLSSIGQGVGIAGQLGAMAMPFLMPPVPPVAPGVGSLASGYGGAGGAGGGYGGALGLNSSLGGMFG